MVFRRCNLGFLLLFSASAPLQASGFSPVRFAPNVLRSTPSLDAAAAASSYPSPDVGVADCLAILEKELLQTPLSQICGRNTVPTSPFLVVERDSGEFAVDAFVDADCNDDENDTSMWIVDLKATAQNFQKLYDSVGAVSSGQIEIRYDDKGVRGVHLVDRPDNSIQEGGVVLSVPLSSCMVDDDVPDWMERQQNSDDGDAYHLADDWASRLAASVVNLQLTQPSASWLSMLPNPLLLAASLPVHWPEEVVTSTRCTALELAVDSAYFARASAAQDIMDGLSECKPDMETSKLQKMCDRALDLVQTRSCRVVMEDGTPRRVLAPLFDMINHGNANAEFALEDETHLVVRATRDLKPGEEIRIDYGSSARPAWHCLLSYGFVPEMNEDGEDVAEIYLDGVRYEVGPSFIPTELVEAAIGNDGDENSEITLTPEIGRRLAQRLSDVAYQLILEPEPAIWEDDKDEGATVDPSLVIAHQLATALRWSQHRVLASCAIGLRDFANEEQPQEQ